MKKLFLPIIASLTLFAAAISVHAADGAAAGSTAMTSPSSLDPDAWQFGIAIPLWAPAIGGNVTVRGHKADVNVNFSELKSHLDASFSLAVAARKGKFDLYGDVGYMRFSANQKFPDGHVKATVGLKFLVSDAGVGYTFIKTESEHPFILGGTAGVRYWYASMPVTFKEDNTGTNLFSGSKTWNIVDPVIGLRVSQYLTQKLHVDLSGDGGGFNLNNSTDWTWSATGVLTYDFCKNFSLSAGYRALALDESNGSGVGKGGKMGADLVFQGALITLNFRF
jgi:hypothetical protein